MGLLGAAVMALILVKINVGAFAAAAVLLTCVVSYPTFAERRWLRPAVEVGFVALPLLLMISKASEAWARHYAVHVAIAALAVVIALRARSAGRRDPEDLWWLGGGLLVVGATVSVAIVAAGTSPSGLIDGIIRQPLRQSEAFSFPLTLSKRIYVFDMLALAGALGYWYVGRNREARPSPASTSLVSALSIFVGLAIALSVVGRTPLFDSLTFAGFQLGLLSFAWVALIQPPGEPVEGTRFARLLLPSLAVLQALHAFPVAGSQVLWSAFLLIPVGALCVANGVRGIAVSLGSEDERRALFAIGAIAATVGMVVLANTQLKQGLDQARTAYDGSVSLGLPGAKDVRVNPEEAVNYQAIVTAIDRNCESFVMLPGMNSFYIWSQQEPPTGYNATGWPTLFDDAHQQRVIEDTRSIDGLCLLENARQAVAWSGGEVPPGPLVRYLQRDFLPVAEFGEYRLLKREGSAGRGS